MNDIMCVTLLSQPEHWDLARAGCDLNEAVRTQKAAESEASSRFVMKLYCHNLNMFHYC